MIKAKIVDFARQPQQEPTLLLTDAQRSLMASHQIVGKSIGQPICREASDANVRSRQADFFFELPKQGHLRFLATLDTSLRELPAAVTDAPPQKNTAVAMHQQNADVGAKTVCVDEICHASSITPRERQAQGRICGT